MHVFLYKQTQILWLVTLRNIGICTNISINNLEKFAMFDCSLFCISSRIQGYTILGELHMIQVPDTLPTSFEACLTEKNIQKISGTNGEGAGFQVEKLGRWE